MRFLLRSLLAALILAGGATNASAQAGAPAAAEVSGVLRYEGLSNEIKHVYYQRQETREGPAVVLYFAGRALTPWEAADENLLMRGARRDRFLALYVELGSDNTVSHTYLIRPEGTFSGGWRFTPAAPENPLAGGRITSRKGEGPNEGDEFDVDLRFRLAAPPDRTWRGSPWFAAKPTGLALGQASGWVEFNGQKVPLTAAVAIPEPDLFGGPAPRRVILTAPPLPRPRRTP